MTGYEADNGVRSQTRSRIPEFGQKVVYACGRYGPADAWPVLSLSEQDIASMEQLNASKASSGAFTPTSSTTFMNLVNPYGNDWSSTMAKPVMVSQDGDQQRSGTQFSSMGTPSTLSAVNEFKPWLQKQGFKLLEQAVDQVLDFLTMLPETTLLQITDNSNVDSIQVYTALFTSLSSIRKIYKLSDPDWWPYLRPQDLFNIAAPSFLRKHNIALAGMVLLQKSIKMRELHEHFLEIFAPSNEDLTLWQADLCFALKLELTLDNYPNLPETLFSWAFPRNARDVLRHRQKPDNEDVSNAEQLFVDRCTYVRTRYDSGEMNKQAAELLRGGQTWHQAIQRALPHLLDLLKKAKDDPNWGVAAFEENVDHPPPVAVEAYPRPDAAGEEELKLRTATIAVALGNWHATQSSTASPQPIDTTQSIPSMPMSNRRPWSSTEEAALLSGLRTVGGPHWSQILSLYGTNGTISDVLKERNQVQLKDKARNMKLSFLKNGREVPEELKAVTGNLNTRGRNRKEKDGFAAGDESIEQDGDVTMTLEAGGG